MAQRESLRRESPKVCGRRELARASRHALPQAVKQSDQFIARFRCTSRARNRLRVQNVNFSPSHRLAALAFGRLSKCAAHAI
jgi:hypothetical protein